MQMYYKKCLIWSVIGRSRYREVRSRGNVSSDIKIMSAIERYPLHRGFVARVRPSFDTILRKVFVVKIKVSAIKDARYKEVSL